MGTVSVSLPSDGQTIDAADYNTPINTIVTELNGSLDSNNIAEGGVVPNSLIDGTGTSWVWGSWTPTWTNLTVGNGTVTYSKYKQTGKTVTARYRLVFGSTTAVSGDLSFTLPVAAASDYGASNSEPIGTAGLIDTGSTAYLGTVNIASTTSAIIRASAANVTYTTTSVLISSTVPFTWTTSDRIEFSITYEAA